MQSRLSEALLAFHDPNAEAQLRLLDEALRSAEPQSCHAADISSLLGIFERFPEHDGFGVFWSILHTLEACPGYEQHLVASVRNNPCRFNILMVDRLLNAGVDTVGDCSLVALLESATPQQGPAASSAHPQASDA